MRATVDSYVPQCAAGKGSLKGPLMAWSAVLAGALAFLSLILLAPLALAHGYAFLSGLLYQGFSLVCHQLPGRSFHIEGHPLAVCARCFGLYAGFAAGAAAYPLARSLARRDAPPRAWLIVAALPMAIDFTLGFLGVWENTHFSRALTGALVGAVVPFYVVPGLVDLGQSDWGRLWRANAKFDAEALPISSAKGKQ